MKTFTNMYSPVEEAAYKMAVICRMFESEGVMFESEGVLCREHFGREEVRGMQLLALEVRMLLREQIED